MVRAFPGPMIINAGTLKPGHSPALLEVDFVQRLVLAFEFDEDGDCLLEVAAFGAAAVEFI